MWRRVLLPRRRTGSKADQKRRLMHTKRHKGAFTLIELLTVMAIVAVLATLLLTAISSAKKASHRARCTSNLRQISLALNMYLDDYEKRSPDLGLLSASRFLGNRQVLVCPEDKTGGWGNLVNPSPLVAVSSVSIGVDRSSATNGLPDIIPFSYLNPLPWEDWAWERLAKLGNQAGLAVCQLHGLGKPNLDNPSYHDFQGVILRAQRDGAVVKREVYWDLALTETIPPTASLVTAPTTAGTYGNNTDAGKSPTIPGSAQSTIDYPWKLFSDNPNP